MGRVWTSQTIISPVPVPYTGPGDIVSSAFGWWGLRAYSFATVGSNAIRLRRDSDNAEQTFVTLPGGSLDVASITSFKGAANLFVVTLYDQSGTGNDVTQATAAVQPPFSLSILGALPAIDTTAAAAQYRLANTAPTGSITAPFTVPMVARYSTAADMMSLSITGVNEIRGIRANFVVANRLCLDFGGNDVDTAGTSPTLPNVWFTYQSIFDTSFNFCVNGTDNIITGTTVVSVTPTNIYILNFSGNGFPWQGYFTELGIWSGAFSSGQRSAMNSNQRAYWGF